MREIKRKREKNKEREKRGIDTENPNCVGERARRFPIAWARKNERER